MKGIQLKVFCGCCQNRKHKLEVQQPLYYYALNKLTIDTLTTILNWPQNRIFEIFV